MRGINHDIERHVSRFGWHGSGCGICIAQTNCYSDDSLMPVATQLLCGDDGLTVLCSCGAAAGRAPDCLRTVSRLSPAPTEEPS